ncbi:EamA domain-containing membrane protein RarD [Hoeflea marina]|uniref:EamA domain-containing membrane protein RarD n=1 Tax=Hoeflea marina TaxID=274592 RepID=A0A317PDW0_9HYPH|nr:DMT family transporter [Hoeflea marina]PWV95272.1 EamA domain-containing membrane protein RarD [Hoeflea marina]
MSTPKDVVPRRPSIPALEPHVTRGLVLMLLAVTISPIIDIFSKLAIATISPVEITAARFLLQAAFGLPVLVWRRIPLALSWSNTRSNALRGAIICISMVCFVATLRVMAVADAIAIFFVEPIILTVLSSVFLKETIGWRRYTACAVGFCGALLIIQPSFEEVGAIALLPIVSAFAIAVFILLTRMRAGSENAWAMQVQSGLWGLLLCVLMLWAGHDSGLELFAVAVPDGVTLLYLLGVGISASVSGMLGVYAYRAAPASVLAPLQYLEIVSATVVAWFVFGDFPNALKWLGIAIVVGSGLFIIWRERRFSSRPVSGVKNATLSP